MAGQAAALPQDWHRPVLDYIDNLRASGLSYHKIEQACGITRGHLSSVAMGDRAPSWRLLVLLSRGMDEELETIIGEESRKTPPLLEYPNYMITERKVRKVFKDPPESFWAEMRQSILKPRLPELTPEALFTLASAAWRLQGGSDKPRSRENVKRGAGKNAYEDAG